jgi:anti-sigma B factor antagonist
MLRPDDFHLTVSALEDGATLVSVRGDVDIATSPTLSRLLATVQACGRREGSHGHLVIDLSRVTLLDASGLGVLLSAARSADGEALWLRDPSPSCMRVLEITRLTPVFHIDGGPPRPRTSQLLTA